MANQSEKQKQEYDVQCYPINPPVGGLYGYGAKAVVITSSGTRPLLHEHWGKTATEARAKAQQELDEWLEAQGIGKE